MIKYAIKSKYVTNDKGRTVKKVSVIILVLILILLSFGAGMYISQKNDVVKGLAKKEIVYLGQVVGKYSWVV